MGVQCILTIPKDGKTPTPPSTNLTQAERQQLLSPNQGSVYLVESPRGSNEADISPTTLNEAVRSQFLGCSSSECHNGNIVQPTQWCADTGSTISKMLAKQLCEARLEYPKCSRRFFVPNGKQEELITVQAVTQIILEGNEGCSFVSPESARKIAEETCRCARQFFAILAYMKKGPDIRSILREGLSDGDLPLKRRFRLRSGTEKRRARRCFQEMGRPLFREVRSHTMVDDCSCLRAEGKALRAGRKHRSAVH